MRFYNVTHKYYCGIDSRTKHVHLRARPRRKGPEARWAGGLADTRGKLPGYLRNRRLRASSDHLARRPSKRRLSVGAPPGDLRHLGTLIKQFLPYGFLRIHRNHAVNLARIQEIRRRKGREDCEVKLEPPVNRVLPVSRGQVGKLLKVFGPGK